MTDSSELSSVDAANGDLLSSKYVRLNDGSRRRSGALVSEQEETRKKGSSHMNGKARNAAISAVPQDAHLRHYQEHLEERRLKNKRMREGKLVTMLRKKTAVVKKDASTQVTPADLGLDDWDDEEEEEEEDDDEDTCVMNEFTDIYGAYPRPASAAPDPGPWQDVSSSPTDSYNQWYYRNWAGYSGKPTEGPPQLTQEQTYRYVYYYYNYYAALETQDGDAPAAAVTNAEHYNEAVHSQQPQHHQQHQQQQQQIQQQQQYMSMNSNQQAAWPNDASNRQGSASSNKRQMRGLFDEWRRKYEEWYMSTFGQPVNEMPTPENTAMAAHRAQVETARLNALKQQQEMHLERPGRPNSLLPAPPLGQDTSESLLPPPPPPSAPPPESPAPPPPPETPRPETPAAQAAAAAAAAHVLGANVSTPADVAAAIAQLSNSDLAAILSSVNRAARAATPSASLSGASPTSSASTINLLAAATPSLLSLPPLPVIGVPNPLAAPIFPPPMPAALRRDALAAAAAAAAAATATATASSPTTSSTISLVPTSPVLVLPTSLASSSAVTPPSASSGLAAVPQMMMMQPSFKFGPPFKPFGVFQGGTEDKWGPDAPLGRYGQRKEEEEKEAKNKMEVHRKRHLSDANASPTSEDAEDGGSDRASPVASPVASPFGSEAEEEAPPSPSPPVEQQEVEEEGKKAPETEPEETAMEVSREEPPAVNDLAEVSCPMVDGEEGRKEDTDVEVSSNKGDSDSESTSSGGSVCSTATQSVAIGPRRTRTVASVCGGGERPARPGRLAIPTNMSVSSIPVEKLTSLAESAAKRAVSDGIWYAPSQPLNSLRLPKQAMLHTLQSHMKTKVAELLARETDPRMQLTLSYAKALMDSVRHLLDMSVQFVVGSLCRLSSQRAKDFYGWDQLPSEVANSLKLCDVYIGDVFIAQGAAATTLGAKEAAARQAFKVLSRPGYVLGSTRLWMDTDHLVLCISEFPLTVPILPPFLLDPCSPAILHGPQPPSEFGPPGPDGDGSLEAEVGGEVEDEEDWLLQSVAINPKPLEHLWLYEAYNELAVSVALRRSAGCREARLARRQDRQRCCTTKKRNEESPPEEAATQACRRSIRGVSLGDDLHEAALADMSTLSLEPESDQEALEDAVAVDEPDLSGVEIDEEALVILGRSCDFSHMLLSVEVEVNRDATFTCCVFIDRQFCACASDQPSLMKARQLAATRALALLRQSQPAVGLDAPELPLAAVVDSLMWRARYETMRPVHSLLSTYGMAHFEWERIFMYYAESASIEPFFISAQELDMTKWPEVKKEAEKWGLLVKESRVPGASADAPPESAQCLFVCKRMPLATVKRRLMRYGACGHFLLLRRGVYPTSEDEEQSEDAESDEEGSGEALDAPGAGCEADEVPEPIVTMAEVKEEPDELDEPRQDDLVFLGGASSSTDCEILDDLPKTRIPGFDY